MYPIRNDPEHDKDRSEHPCDQSQVSPDENNALANEIVIKHRRPSDHLFVRLPVCPHGNSDYSKACDDCEHDISPHIRERMNLRTLLLGTIAKSYNFELVATDPTQIYNLGVGRSVAQPG